MIVHQHLDTELWDPFMKRLPDSGLDVLVHVGTHERGAVCIETRTPEHTAAVRKIITMITKRRDRKTAAARHHLKKQLITRRTTPCRTKQS